MSDGLIMILASGICALVLGAIVISIILVKSRKFKVVKILGTILLAAIGFLYFSSISLSPILVGAPSPIFQPSDSEIVGVYHLDTSTMLLYEKGYPLTAANGFLVLNDDGKFSTENMPDLITDESNANSEFVTGEGNWRVEFDSLNRDWFLFLQFSELDNEPSNQKTHLHLYGRKAPYILYYTISDPDSHQAISYFKEQ